MLTSNKNTSAFTIVELLIVIVVIAVLATVSIVAYNGIQTRAKNSQIQAAVASYAKSLRLYAVDNGSLPTPTQSGASFVCLGNYSDDTCANGGIITRAMFDALLLQYRGSSARPTLPEEYVYTNNNNNWWRGIWWYANMGQLRFVQYGRTDCPPVRGTTFVSVSISSGNSVCIVSVDT